MLQANVQQILEVLQPEQLVLDIGGWALPFNRANYVIDIEGYDTRGIFGSQGPEEEHFTRQTWITRDLCDKTPYPFPDKFFDFVICSHTLEDIRDPLWVCSEITRIGKRGYIEVPSAESEIAFGVENKRYAGRYHHRWVIDIQDGEIIFTHKHHHIHSSWQYHLPRRFYHGLPPEKRVQYLFWEGSFSFRENIMLSSEAARKFYFDRVRALNAYAESRYSMEKLRSSVKKHLSRVLRS